MSLHQCLGRPRSLPGKTLPSQLTANTWDSTSAQMDTSTLGLIQPTNTKSMSSTYVIIFQPINSYRFLLSTCEHYAMPCEVICFTPFLSSLRVLLMALGGNKSLDPLHLSDPTNLSKTQHIEKTMETIHLYRGAYCLLSLTFR